MSNVRCVSLNTALICWLLTSFSVAEKAMGQEVAAEMPHRAVEAALVGATVNLRMPDGAESMSIRLRENGVAEWELPPAPSPVKLSWIKTPRWRSDRNNLTISMSFRCSVATDYGEVIATIRYVVTLTSISRTATSSTWSGNVSVEAHVNTENLPKHARYPVRATISNGIPVITEESADELGEDLLMEGAEGIQEGQLANLQTDADQKLATAEQAAQKAQADEAAFKQQMGVVDAAEQQAAATAAAGANTAEEVGEVTQKYDALGREQAMLDHLDEAASQSRETANALEETAEQSAQDFFDAKQIGDKITNTLGTIDVVDQLLKGDRKRKQLNDQGDHKDAWIETWATVGGVTATAVTTFGTLGGKLPGVTQFFVDLGLEAAGQKIGAAFGAWQADAFGLQNRPSATFGTQRPVSPAGVFRPDASQPAFEPAQRPVIAPTDAAQNRPRPAPSRPRRRPVPSLVRPGAGTPWPPTFRPTPRPGVSPAPLTRPITRPVESPSQILRPTPRPLVSPSQPARPITRPAVVPAQGATPVPRPAEGKPIIRPRVVPNVPPQK